MILPLEERVCLLKLAQKMKELGFRQESLYYWVRIRDGKWRLEEKDNVVGNFVHTEVEYFSAFTAAELEVIIPGNVGGMYFVIQKGLLGNVWYCKAEKMGDSDEVELFEAKNLANAMAKMLIYLAEQGLIKPNQE